MRMRERKREFVEKYFKFATAVDLNKCFKQINSPNSLYICALILELPSNTSAIIHALSWDRPI